MSYATQQDLTDALGADRLLMLAQLSDGTRDDAKITRALNGASAVIDGYISNRCTLPLAAPPATLLDACVAIAAYRLASEPGALTEDMRTRYEDAISFLRDIARGVAGLGIATGSTNTNAAPSPLSGPNSVLLEGDERLFTRQSLRKL